MKTISSVVCIVGVLAMTLFAGTAMAAESKGAPIIIGVLENAKYAFTPMMKNSLNMALENINGAGGINGRPIKLVFANDGGEKKMGINAVKKLVKEDKVVMLVGGYSSSNTFFMAQTADRLDTPFLVCTAADDRITQRKKINIFRLNPPAAEYTTGLEKLLLEEVKPASMAIMYENSPYGTSGGLRMMYFCRENDIDIHAIIPYHKERIGNADYLKRIVKLVKEDPPELIYMVSYMKDAVALVKQIRAEKIKSLLCGGAGGFTHPDFIKMAGEPAQYLLTATLWTDDQEDPLANQYADLYRAQHKQTPDYHGVEAYSALIVVADALRRSKSLNANDIRDALAKTDIDTPFGKVAFKSYGKFERQSSRETLVLQAIGDNYRCVWPKEVSVADLVLPKK